MSGEQDPGDFGAGVIESLLDGDPATWAAEYGLTFPVLDDSNRSTWNIYGEGYIPLNLVLDQTFTIRYKASGYDESAIRAAIEQYLPPL